MATVDWLFGNTAILIFFSNGTCTSLVCKRWTQNKNMQSHWPFDMEHLPKSWIASRKKLFFWKFFLGILFSYQNESDLTQHFLPDYLHHYMIKKTISWFWLNWIHHYDHYILPQTKHFYTKKKQLECVYHHPSFFYRFKYRERKKMLQAGIILRHKEVTK